MVAKDIMSMPELEGLSFEIREICSEAFAAQDEWEKLEEAPRRVGWKWRELVDKFRRQHNSRLDVAIWHNGQLAGLALGKVSTGKLVVRVCYAEGAPVATPLTGSIFPIIDAYLEQYAAALGIQTIALQDPLDEVISYYRRFGYKLADDFDHRNHAMTRNIDQDVS
jgi:hypothetical protein